MSPSHYLLKEMNRLTLRMISASLSVFFLCLSPTMADNVITNGATMRINSGTFVTTLQNVLVKNGGKLILEGSLNLKNNFTNQNTVEDLGKGTMEFSGSVVQSITGQNTLGKLLVNNPAGLDLMGNTILNNELGLLKGAIRLGPSNLTLGNKATISSTPSASAMVVATGSGELRKSFLGTGIFTFPVGNESLTGEYTPVTLNFTDGSFAPDNYVGVTLKTATLPGYSGNSLKRCWLLTQSGISRYHYDATFQYVPGDNNGNENELLCVKAEPNSMISYNSSNSTLHQLTASGLSSFGIFTGIVSLDHVSISSNIETDKFNCFPNPFTQEITIEIQNSKNDEMNVEIYNLSGKRIKNLYKGITNGNLKLKWDATNESGQYIAPGVYLFKVNGQSKQVIYEGMIGRR